MNELRCKIKNKRDSLKEEQRTICSFDICDALYEDIKASGLKDVLAYMPFGSEVDIRELLYSLFDDGYNLYFPLTGDEDIIFYMVNDLADFGEGRYGILEPFDCEVPFDINKSAYVITPGVVFDLQKNRLGYGAGYYDRFFAKAKSLIKVGVCFDMQIVDHIETKSWDVSVDKIITEKRVIS